MKRLKTLFPEVKKRVKKEQQKKTMKVKMPSAFEKLGRLYKTLG
jgi:hypothetical protein